MTENTNKKFNMTVYFLDACIMNYYHTLATIEIDGVTEANSEVTATSESITKWYIRLQYITTD